MITNCFLLDLLQIDFFKRNNFIFKNNNKLKNYIMAKSKEQLEKELKQSAEDLKDKSEESYDRLIDRLDRERKHITNELDKDYKEARRYVRSNPEEGVLMAFAGGLAVGLLLGIIKK